MCCFDNLITLTKNKMHFISPELEDYIEQHSERTGLTRCIEQRNLPKDSLPRMLSGHFRVEY
jgi:hypothetical protein